MNSKKNITSILLCLFLSIVAMIPFYLHGVLNVGIDIRFHISRIYELAMNIKNGGIYPYMSTFSFNQVGVQSSQAYSSVLLYPFALLLNVINNRVIAILIGLNLILFSSMVVNLWMALKFWSGYYKKSLLFSFIYTLSPFYFSVMFSGFTFGEGIAIIFLPMIAFGSYSIFFRNTDDWIILVLGMSGVIYSHLLSALMDSLLVFAIIVISSFYADDFFKKLKYIFFAILTTVGATSFYWVNFFTLYFNNNIHTTKIENLESNAVYVGDAIINAINGHDNLGLVISIFTIVALFSWNKLTISIKWVLTIGLVFFIATTNIIPWEILQRTPFRAIQFPARFLTIAVLLLAIVTTDRWSSIIEEFHLKTLLYLISYTSILVIFLGTTFSFFNSTAGDKVYNFESTQSKPLPFGGFVITNKNFNNFTASYNDGVGSSDYWPEKSVKNFQSISNNEIITKHKKIVKKPIAKPNKLTFNFKLKKSQSVDFPILFYKNTNVTVNSKKVTAIESTRGTMQISKLSKGDNKIQFYYKKDKIVEVAAFVSWFSFLGCIIYLLRRLFSSNLKDN